MSTRKKNASLEQTLATQNAALLKILEERGQPQKQSIIMSNMSVGLRNISSFTIGISDSPTPNEEDVQLAAAVSGQKGGVAVVSYPWYRQIRSGRLFGKGMLVRDDSVLGPIDVPAPADAEGDIHPDHKKHSVEFPHEWIESRSEAQLRRDIKTITDEAPLRRIAAAVDDKVEEYRKKFGCDGQDKEKEEEAALALPSAYTLVEKLVEQRLNEMAPGLIK